MKHFASKTLLSTGLINTSFLAAIVLSVCGGLESAQASGTYTCTTHYSSNGAFLQKCACKGSRNSDNCNQMVKDQCGENLVDCGTKGCNCTPAASDPRKVMPLAPPAPKRY